MISNSLKVKRSFKNKHVWKYKFIFRDSYFQKKKTYTINTDEGYKTAEYYADNNRRWDAFKDMEYVGRTIVKDVINETIS
jgi:hypothetical protein